MAGKLRAAQDELASLGEELQVFAVELNMSQEEVVALNEELRKQKQMIADAPVLSEKQAELEEAKSQLAQLQNQLTETLVELEQVAKISSELKAQQLKAVQIEEALCQEVRELQEQLDRALKLLLTKPGTVKPSGVNRAAELKKVFAAFDDDISGWIGRDELMRMGQRRKELGQKKRVWTEECNTKLIEKMSSDGNSVRVSEEDFVMYYTKALQDFEDQQFLGVMREFLLCAEAAKQPALSTNTTAIGMRLKEAGAGMLSLQTPNRLTQTEQSASPSRSNAEIEQALLNRFVHSSSSGALLPELHGVSRQNSSIG